MLKQFRRLALWVGLLGLMGYGQTVTPITITIPDSSTTATVPVRLTAASFAPVSTLEFDVGLPGSGLVFVSSANGADLPSGKNVSSSVTGSPAKVKVLIFGLNQTAFASGEIAKLTFKGVSGTYTLPISGIVAASPTGSAVTANGTNGSVMLP